ncbi:hypothetical protein IGI49_004757 [Enterococcus sp. AZ071]|uniref:Uncharacterized protein n=1 Tax=Candidatus Enterococcus ferrettii TaxID=2815324 RepID=A0ABV0ETI1_9ENTE
MMKESTESVPILEKVSLVLISVNAVIQSTILRPLICLYDIDLRLFITTIHYKPVLYHRKLLKG